MAFQLVDGAVVASCFGTRGSKESDAQPLDRDAMKFFFDLSQQANFDDFFAPSIADDFNGWPLKGDNVKTTAVWQKI